jgi:hypothetical protein
MINIDVKHTRNTHIKREYPYIGIVEENSLVVYFTTRNTGICLATGKTSNTQGNFYLYWDEPQFTLFNGTITITQ